MGELQGVDAQGKGAGCKFKTTKIKASGSQWCLESFLVVITTEMLLASKDAVKHPPGHRTTSTIPEDYLAPNINSVETDKPCFRHISSGRSGFEVCLVFFFNIYSFGWPGS